MIIGKFERTALGGWSGVIHSLMICTKARFVPNDNKRNDRSPDFRIVSGNCDIDVAWRRSTVGTGPRGFLSVKLDDPSLSEPLSAALFESSTSGEAELVWGRQGEGVLTG